MGRHSGGYGRLGRAYVVIRHEPALPLEGISAIISASPLLLEVLPDEAQATRRRLLHAVLSLALLGSWAAARSADEPDRVRGDGNRAA